MRDYITLFVVAIFYLVLESTIMTSVPMPDVLLLIVFYIAARKPSTAGVLVCFALGYLEDILIGGVLGSTSFSFMAVFITVYLLTKKVHFNAPAVQALTALCLAAMKVFLIYAIMSSINSDLGLSTITLLQIILTSVFAPFVINLLERLESLVSAYAFEK
ncbi:MAG: rod shape-determining protein MreD [Thermodesulfobacteriota bacterium]